MDKSASEGSKVVVISVAGRAIQVGRYMSKRFTSTDRAVMARRAIVHDAPVVKRRLGKVRMHNTTRTVAICAILVVGIGWYVVKELAHTDYIVVAGVTTTHKRRAGMIKGASAKSPRGMTNLAVLGGRHVLVERGGRKHTGRRTRPVSNMTGIALSRQNSRVGVVDAKCRDKTFGVMATATITGSVLMNLSIRRSSGFNTSVSIVA